MARLEVFAILLLFMMAVFIHGMAGSFDKRLNGYPDELKYFSLARGFAMGHGMTVRGEETSFQKVAYPLVIAPLLRVHDIDAAIGAVNWLNSALAMTSILFAWLIGVQLGLHPWFRMWLAMLTALWPETCVTMTFMSENLYWPLFLCFSWLWLAVGKSPSAPCGFALGALGFATYLCKESFLAMFGAATAFALAGVLRRDTPVPDVPNAPVGASRRMGAALAFPTAFLILFALSKTTLFSGMGHSYHQSSPAAIMSPFNACYLAYAFLYFLSAILASLLIVPFSVPLALHGRLSPQARRLFDLSVAFFVIAALGTSYSISIREDLGAITPRVHMRYVAPALILVIAAFLSLVQDLGAGAIRRAMARRAAMATLAIALFSALIFKCPSTGCSISDQACLGWTEAVRNHFHFYGPSRATFHMGRFVVSSLILLLAAMPCVAFARRGARAMIATLLAILFALTAYNDFIRVSLIRAEYGINPALKEEILALNDQLWNLGKSNSVACFVIDGRIGDFAKHLDTFLHLRCKTKFLYDTRRLDSWDLDTDGADVVILCSGCGAHRDCFVEGGVEIGKSDSFTVFKAPQCARHVTVSTSHDQ